MKSSIFRNFGPIFLCLFFGRSLAFELKLLLNNETVNPLELLIPTIHSDNEKCRAHSLMYKQELANFTVWATDMFDASTKFPSGIFFGSFFDVGNFDECIRVRLPENIGFSGKHCMAHFKMRPLSPIAVEKGDFYEYDKYNNIFNMSIWYKIAEFSQDATKQSRDELYFTFCLPSSCSYEDLQKILRKKIDFIKDMLPFQLDVNVDEKHCNVDQPVVFTKADKIFIAVVIIFVLFGVTATLYHLITKLEGMEQFRFATKTHEIMKSFSYSHTLKKMATESEDKDGMNVMHGMKTLSMFLIMMGHRMMFSITSPLANPIRLEEGYRQIHWAFLLNGPIVVDTFFTISGFLACYLILLEIEKRKKMINVFTIYLHRFVRLTPAYAIVLAFYCTVFIKLGEGPFWRERIEVEQERCIASWWANIFYINNYVNTDKLCMFQSWYLTCDTHYFIIAPFIAYLLWKRPKMGLAVLGVLTTIFVVVPFIVLYINHEDPFLKLYIKLLRDPVANTSFQKTYIPSHMRAAPYLVGMIFGYAKYWLGKTGYKLPKNIRYATWFIGWSIMNAILFSGYMFYVTGETHNYAVAALYGTLHHFFWSVCMGLLIIFVSEGYGKWVAPILNWRPWALLSRITYTAYLVHGAVQMYSVATIRYPAFAGVFNLCFYMSADIVLSYSIALFLSLVFESPIIGMEKIFLRRAPSENDENKSLEPKSKKEVYTDIFIPKINPVFKSDE